MNTTTVANEILRQLGGNKFLVMTGAENLLADENELAFTLPRNGGKVKRVKITLDKATDLYTLSLIRSWSNVMNLGGLNVEQMLQAFGNHTGLRLSL